ncbi:helix-turn-helix domain-containing protein [uncultured Bacteroides sp.]|jgi:AraC-like DNA-binding protein|uniref:helix-turn-helix domain-containing protein n=1 Tax=uncultured Bacteroides sp. TaxID=162156 RepID=UPI0025981D9A|nr:helix-turn-helix domain-containing protein [uncultured Bacteroides sp.]
MTENRLYDMPMFPKDETANFHEGDILLFNTCADNCFPSKYVGRYHIHILCYSGKAQFTMSERNFLIKENDFVPWTIDSEITDVLYSPDFNADFLLVSHNFLIENNPQTAWATKGYIYIKSNPVFSLEQTDLKLLQADFSRFREQLCGNTHIFRREILGRQMQIFLFDLWNIYANEINRQEQLSNISANLFSCFLDLVRQRVTENREVGFYANLLCVTPKYLSEVVRKGSGKSVSYWINGYAMQEIVTMLKNSDITLSEISDRMNFYSQSHFSRFVKKMLGVSPSEYRSELDKKHNKI